MLVPLVLLALFFLLLLTNAVLHIDLAVQKVASDPSPIVFHPYPVLLDQSAPEVTAKAAIVMDQESKVVLFAKQPELRFSMASTTKIMTALVGLDYYQDNSLLQVSSIPVEGSQLGFRAGDVIMFKNLLYAMLLLIPLGLMMMEITQRFLTWHDWEQKHE